MYRKKKSQREQRRLQKAAKNKIECAKAHSPAAAGRTSDIFHSAAVRSVQKTAFGSPPGAVFDPCLLVACRRSSFRLWA